MKKKNKNSYNSKKLISIGVVCMKRENKFFKSLMINIIFHFQVLKRNSFTSIKTIDQ